jgi:small subunit ribosomal protein S25
MHEKWSTTILKELMEIAGGDPWRQWKVKSAAAGMPLVPGEENEPKSQPTPNGKMMSTETNQVEVPIPPPVPKTGISAVLP